MEKSLIATVTGQKTARKPVWFLRQAGRYLPEYQEVRKKLDFETLCRTPKKAAEVTLQPLKRFDLDAAIIFSDILIICTEMGQKLSFDGGHGPQLAPVVRTEKDIANLVIPDAEASLGFVGEAISETKLGLRADQTMIGFAGAPLTVASYMVEGSGSKSFTALKTMLYREPTAFTRLLETIAQATVGYLKMQIKAGADIVMLFDSWAHQVPPGYYETYVRPAVSTIIDAIHEAGCAVIYYPGQGAQHYQYLSSTGSDVIAVDWRVPLKEAIAFFDSREYRPCVQGNLDPQLLMADPSVIKDEVYRILDEGRSARGHIFNVGHGLLPHIPIGGLEAAIAAVRSWQAL